MRKRTWKERKACYLVWIPLTFIGKFYMLKTCKMSYWMVTRDVKVPKSGPVSFIGKFYMLQTLYVQNKLLNGYKRCQSVEISPHLIFTQKTIWSILHPVSPLNTALLPQWQGNKSHIYIFAMHLWKSRCTT